MPAVPEEEKWAMQQDEETGRDAVRHRQDLHFGEVSDRP
jgi:hypothetical protein